MIDLTALPTDINSISNIVMVNPSQSVGIKPQLITDTNKATASLPKPTLSGIGKGLKSAVTPGQNDPNQSFFFHITAEESVNLASDVTDHYVEDNTSIQDHVALRPETITLTGYIGELNDVTPPGLGLLRAAADKLSSLGPFVPALSYAAIVAYNNAAQIYATAITAKNAVSSVFDGIGASSITGGKAQTKQAEAFTKFYTYWTKRQTFQVQTPWAVFPDMIITNLKITQGEDTRMISDFEITFKRLRYAKTITSKKVKQASDRAAAGAAEEVNHGEQTPPAEIDLNAALTQNSTQNILAS